MMIDHIQFIQNISAQTEHKTFGLHLLSEDDLPNIQTLFTTCSDFFDLVYGNTNLNTEARALFTDCPKGKTPADKLLIGLHHREYTPSKNLIGLLELIKHYPNYEDWYIGLLVIEPSQRNKYIATTLLQQLATALKNQSAKKLKLIVQKQNHQAIHFWQKHGFTIEKETVQELPTKSNIVLHMTKIL